MSRVVAMSALPNDRSRVLLEQFHRGKRLGRSRSKTVEGELRFLAGLHADEDIVVFLQGRLPLPIKVRRIARRQLEARPARKNRVLLRAAATQHEILHAV